MTSWPEDERTHEQSWYVSTRTDDWSLAASVELWYPPRPHRPDRHIVFVETPTIESTVADRHQALCALAAVTLNEAALLIEDNPATELWYRAESPEVRKLTDTWFEDVVVAEETRDDVPYFRIPAVLIPRATALVDRWLQQEET